MSDDRSRTRTFRSNFFFFITGMALGVLIMILLPARRQRRNSGIRAEAVKMENQSSLSGKISKFVNPSTSIPEYRQYNFKIIDSLKPKVETFLRNAISGGSVTAVSVYFRDLTNDQWFGINERELFTPASLLKVPVMIAILKMAETRRAVLTDKLIYQGRQEHIYTGLKEDEIIANTVLIPGLEYTVDKLLSIMITDSDNEATILLINYLDGKDINFLSNVQKDLGLEIADNVEMNDDFISVRRYSSFFRTLFNVSYLNEEMSEKALSLLAKTGYGFGIRQAIPQDIIISHKFGDRQLSAQHFQQHHFAIVYYPRKPFLIGIMTKGKDSGELKKLIAAVTVIVFDEIKSKVEDRDEYLYRDLE